MKIKLKISEKQLNSLVYCFNFLDKTLTKDREIKVARSVLDKVVIKFKKKQVEVQQGVNLFTKNKHHCFSFEIVEAHYLERFTMLIENHPLSDYDHNAIRQIQSQINQQLV